MSSNRGGGQSNRGKNTAPSSNFDTDQLNHAVQGMNLDSAQDDGWEVISKKNKNKPANAGSSKQYASQTPKQNPRGQQRGNQQVRPPNNVWANASVPPNNVWANQTGGRGGGGVNYNPTPNAVRPPLQSGWNWNARPNNNAGQRENTSVPQDYPVEEEFEDRVETESEDELLSDEYDSDEGSKSHEERKKNRWHSEFFETLDGLSLEQINESSRQWHCPACQNGPGAIDWYRSLPALIAHAKTKGSKRVQIHRDLAELLEEELRIRGAMVMAAGESYGHWKGLNQVVRDREIVWPPMVVIMNTQLDQDDNNKWVGMGNQELLDYFGSYQALRARHSYGPRGHRGMSVLIFESSAVGYTEAERLNKHFENQGTHRIAWENRPNLFYPGGKRLLYGYMATPRDIEYFNQHCQAKTRLKFELVSYQDKVVNHLKQMNEENQQLNWYKNKVVKEQMHSKALEESFGLVSQKLRKTEEENRIVRDRTQRYHDQNQEEMDYQEQFFKDQLKIIQNSRNARETQFEELQKEERRRVNQSNSTVGSQKREEKLREMKEFEEEREKMMKLHEEKMAEMKSRHWKEELELEEGFNAELTQLMEKYTP